MRNHPSKRTRKLKASPYRGTGKFIQYMRCPICGKLGRGPSLGNAGQHHLTMSRPVSVLPGYRAGFLWEHRELTSDELLKLLECLESAKRQIERALRFASFKPRLSFVPLADRVPAAPMSDRLYTGLFTEALVAEGNRRSEGINVTETYEVEPPERIEATYLLGRGEKVAAGQLYFRSKLRLQADSLRGSEDGRNGN